MKKLFSLLLTCVLLVAACSKKETGTPTPGKKKTDGQIINNKPVALPRDVNNPLKGWYVSECFNEKNDSYLSQRIVLIVENDKMTQQYARFTQLDCPKGDTGSVMVGANWKWDYITTKAGAINGSPWEITYTTYQDKPLNFNDKVTMTNEYDVLKDDMMDKLSFSSEEDLGITYERYSDQF